LNLYLLWYHHRLI